MKKIVVLLVISALVLAHIVCWLMTKGIIWVMFELFNINWYGKFWVVYVAFVIVSIILKEMGRSCE